MSKSPEIHHLPARPILAAIAMSALLIAFGCTTDRTLGDGNLHDRSGVRMTPTSGLSTGSETPPLPVPMTSSYSRPEPVSTPSGSMQKLSAEQAALIFADQRPAVRVLGRANPGVSDVNESLNTASADTASASSSGVVSYGTVSREGTTILSVPATARNVTPTTTAASVNPVSTARSIKPASTAVNINPTTTSTVRIVSDGGRVTVTNQ